MNNLVKATKEDLINFVGAREGVFTFVKDEHIQIEGAFAANEKLYIIYKQVATSEEIEAVKGNNIFAKLKVYGSSGKYKGIVDGDGNSVFPNIYHSILPFMNDIIKIEVKGNKFGLMRLSGEIILKPIYDRIDPLGELVFAVTIDGKLGFMNLKGETVIPFEYEAYDEDVVFYNGLACVSKQTDNGSKFGYIDHNNEIVIPFQFSLAAPFKNKDYIENWITYPAGCSKSYTREIFKLALDGTMIKVESEHIEDSSWEITWEREWEANHAYDESRRYADDNSLDAFEGDESNRWNID